MKCIGFCGGGSLDLNQLSGVTFGQAGLDFSVTQVTTFETFVTGLQGLSTVCTNTVDAWNNVQTMQIQQQFGVMALNFYSYVSFLQQSCPFCGPNPPLIGQFQAALTQLLQQIQAMLLIITGQAGGSLSPFMSNFQIVSTCVQALFGVAQSVGVQLTSVFSGLNTQLFQTCSIDLNSFMGMQPTALFQSVTTVKTVVVQQQTTLVQSGLQNAFPQLQV